MNWSLIPTISAPMPLQMAFDEMLFEEQKRLSQNPLLRFSVASAPWISAGYSFRDASSLSKSELIRTHPGVPLCRRKTGGGCVLHGDDLMVALLARTESDPARLEAVRTSYRAIHESVQRGLEHVGFAARFYDQEEIGGKGNDCFAAPVESDLTWKGQKIAGGAQKRSEGVLMHQESIRIPSGVDLDRLIQAIRQGFEHVFAITLQETKLDPDLYFQAERRASSYKL